MVKQNINLYLASPRGFCAGVDRAVKIVEQAIKKYGSPIYVRHEIVHNKDVVKSLESLGAIFVDEITDAPENSTIIFSAHGVPKSVFVNAKKRKMLSIDATCPLVTKVHNETIKHFNSSRKILLICHKNHPEVIGTMGQVPDGNVILIESLNEAKNIYIENTNNLAYATQTTLSVDDTKEIIEVLKQRFPDIKGPSTEDICYATTNRQLAVKSMADMCNYILVIGAQNSSNSQRLVEVAKKNGVSNSYLISDEDDLNIFLNNFNFKDSINIGLTAGASAPETLVQILISKLKRKFEVNLINHEVVKEDIILNKNDFISPKPIENNEGEILNKFNTKNFILVNFLEGKPKVNITDNDCYLIGDLIGNLQNKSRYFDLIRKNSLSLEDCKKIFQDCKNSISEKEIDNLSNGLCDLIEDSLKDCLEKWPSHLPKGIIHGDLFPDNVFFLNNKVSGVIDFYFSCVDIKIYEIAIVINAWCFDQHNTLNIEKVIIL